MSGILPEIERESDTNGNDSSHAGLIVPINPLDNNLILKLVLEQVGKANPIDLKNCRLVNRSWNRVAVPILEQQHGYAMELNNTKLNAYSALLRRAQLARGINIEELTSLRVSLNVSLDMCFHVYFDSMGTDPVIIQTCSLIELLLLHRHLRVAYLKCTQTSCSVSKLIKIQVNWELFSLLKMISSTLTSITICYEDSIQQHCPSFEEFDFQGYYSTLTFPKLKSLSYKTVSWSPLHEPRREGSENLTRHVISIIETARAPKLTNLALDLWEGRREGGANSLLRTILKGCSSRLESLEIVEGDLGHLWRTLAEPELQLPKLKRFKNVNGFFMVSTWADQFLVQNCPSLRSLQLSWSHVCEERLQRLIVGRAEPRLFGGLPFPPFPFLPNVIHFEFKAHFCKEFKYLKRVHATFTTILAKLPSLKCLSIELEIWCMLGYYFYVHGFVAEVNGRVAANAAAVQFPTFPQVTTMEIQINHPQEEMVNMMNLSTPEMYHQFFPNLTTLILKVEKKILPFLSSSGPAIITWVLELLSRHPRVRSLEIHNYRYDWPICPITTEAGARITNLDEAAAIPILQPQLTHVKFFTGSGTGSVTHVDHLNFKRRFPSLLSLQLNGIEQIPPQ